MVTIFTATQLRACLLVLVGLLSSRAAWSQCATCSTTLTDNVGDYVARPGEVICILAGTTYSHALSVPSDGVTICNSGSLTGTLRVGAGVVGTVINNTGSIATNDLLLAAATTINNGSSDGGATVVAGATWSGYLPGTILVPPTIYNYATISVQLQPVAGATITNAPGATWNGYLTTSANLTITNAGTWSTQIQEAGNSPTISIMHNGGSWTGGIGGGSGSLRITNNATWTQGFNFPDGSANAFTTAAGATTTFNGYLGLGGTVALTNNGTMNVATGMGAIGAGSRLTNAASSTFAVTYDFVNQGTVVNLGALTASGNFTNNGTFTGPAALPRGQVQAAGYTVNNGSFGADGSYLDFCDGTPPAPASNGFDARGGTIGANVSFCAATASTQPLPVTLTSFTATLRAETVLVQWTTAAELNNQEFVLERSADGRQYQALQTVAGRGTVLTASTYTTTDSQPLPGLSYYRLRQVDLDGTRRYSPAASVRRTAATISAYPNPTPDALTLDLRALPAGPCTVRLLNLPGQLVLAQALAGGQAQPLSLAALPAGTYLLEVSSPAQGRSVQRIVKN
jgi:hypothetical protein